MSWCHAARFTIWDLVGLDASVQPIFAIELFPVRWESAWRYVRHRLRSTRMAMTNRLLLWFHVLPANSTQEYSLLHNINASFQCHAGFKSIRQFNEFDLFTFLNGFKSSQVLIVKFNLKLASNYIQRKIKSNKKNSSTFVPAAMWFHLSGHWYALQNKIRFTHETEINDRT